MSLSVIPGCSEESVNAQQQQLLSTTAIALVALVPALASLFLAWISRLQQHRLGRTAAGPSPSLAMAQRLITVAHVVLISTSASFVLGLGVSIAYGFRPVSPDPALPSSTSHLLTALLIGNAVSVITFQTAGEGALLYQFLCLYPGTRARATVLPLAAVLFIARLVSQVANHVLRILIYAMPSSPTLPLWQRLHEQIIYVYTFSLMSIILLLSATFVFKLWTRWHRYCADNQGRLPKHGSMQRVRSVFIASCHHTVITSIAVILMTVTFLLNIRTNLLLRWINHISIITYKLSFSLGIAKSLFHLCFDPSALARASSPRRLRFQHAPPPCRCHYQAVTLRDMEAQQLGGSATRPADAQPHPLQPPAFQYNSWDSGTLSMTQPLSDTPAMHVHCQTASGPLTGDSWPIVSISIVTETGSPTTNTAMSLPRPSLPDGSVQTRPDIPPNQLNLAAQTRRGPEAVISEFTHFIGYRFATSARFYASSCILSESGSGLSGSCASLIWAIRECHSTMTELIVVPSSSSSPSSPDEKPCTLLVPIHFNGIKLGVLVCTPWNHPSPAGQHLRPCMAECCVAKRKSTATTGAVEANRPSGVCRSVCKDRVHELLRRLSGFFAAYLHSAKQRKVNQETVRQFQHQLALVEATAQAKGTFLANMSHEIRTPAAQVIQAAHILSETQLDPMQEEHVDVILKSSEFLLAILNDILDLSKLENGKIRFENRPFALHDAIRHSVDAYAGNRAKPLVDVGYVIDKNVPVMVVGDVVRFRQIWNNLLSNAVKFTEAGSIILRAERVAPVADSGERVVLRFSVTDTGSGIPEDRLAHIFERFEQSDESVTRLYGGTGLGLSISQSLCLLMNSSLHVHSTVGQGSTFSFEVDLTAVPCPPAPELSSRPSVAVLPAASISLPDSIRIETIARLLSTHCNVVPIREAHVADIQLIIHGHDWPELNDAIPTIPTVYICSSSAPPPTSNHRHVAFVARPFKQSHLFRVLDSLSAATPIVVAAPPADLLQPQPPSVTRHDSMMLHALTRPPTPPPRPLEPSAIPPPPALNATSAGANQAPQSFRVLVVDDNPLNRRLLVAMLTRLGHVTEQACDGKEAVDRVLDNNKPQLDCIFLDVRMPVMDGLEATRQIVHHFSMHQSADVRRRPIIIGLSADAMTEQEDEGLLNGMDKYLRKPVLKKDLMAALQDFVADRRSCSIDQ